MPSRRGTQLVVLLTSVYVCSALAVLKWGPKPLRRLVARLLRD